jgi:hypothetical protein
LPRQLPWWFETSFGEHEVTRPKGVLERFHSFGFDKTFGTFNNLAEETQWHQFASLKYEIESIRAKEPVRGYVVTGITDVHWEVNGLLDMWRNEKAYAKELSALQQPDVIMCKLNRHSFRSGESVEFPTIFSHFSDLDLSGAKVRWSTEWAGGQFTLPSGIQRGTVVDLDVIRVELPRVEIPTIEQFEIQIRTRSGHRIAENSYELFILPPENRAENFPIGVNGNGLGPVHSRLGEAGYLLSDHTERAGLLLTNRYDSIVENHLQDGGSVVLVAASEDALPAGWPIKIKARAGTELDGRWFSNYNWIRRDRPPFSRVAFTPILGFESASVAPLYVIDGISPQLMDDVLSGITFGWLNRNCALALQMSVGRGKLVLTTFRFDSYGNDAYTTDLLDSMIAYVSGPECQPEFRVAIENELTETERSR